MRYEESCGCGSQLVIVDARELGDVKGDLERRTTERIKSWRDDHTCSLVNTMAEDAIRKVLAAKDVPA